MSRKWEPVFRKGHAPTKTLKREARALTADVSPTSPEAALVLFSGGQDSTVCLAWALERFARVETIGFDYGQRHRVELEARLACGRTSALRPALGQRLGEDHAVRLAALGGLRQGAHPRHRDRDRRERIADHLRARP